MLTVLFPIAYLHVICFIYLLDVMFIVFYLYYSKLINSATNAEIL